MVEAKEGALADLGLGLGYGSEDSEDEEDGPAGKALPAGPVAGAEGPPLPTHSLTGQVRRRNRLALTR